MQTAVYSLSPSGNVLDLNAYRRSRDTGTPFFPEGPIEDDEPQPFPWDEPEAGTFEEESDAPLPFPGAEAYRERLSVGAIFDIAASAAMIVSALAVTFLVFF